MMRTPRSYLFVPGIMPERFAKATGSGADAIILDLEDAVGPGAKSEARDHVVAWFGRGGRGLVRVNAADTPWFQDDLAALSRCDISAVMVPKATPDSLSAVAEKLPGRALIGLIETAEGLAALRRSATCPGVSRLAFGNLDFSADTRIPGTGPVLDPARFEIVLASRLAGLVPPVDGVTTELRDGGVLAEEVARSRRLGFGAKLCIHPAQVAFTNDGFTPSEGEVAWARRVLSALSAADGSVVQVDGKMVDKPLIDRARQVLADTGRGPP
ncbi:citrate lyase subunit beta / citryl-CoA lyase [Paracoccus isoporae]|uniref:Citrate lyase subunit beta / citryl-CoA lyase n=1 Tax=Paracoccus isoporae TaxID=591205 RepID=A0A1G7CQG2_9RHOB|nr:CoA ester lyase [Paracoccus isoporae]SDE40735.1 citrate lyase subunit beta / citryl-CoA lyase [Paracoccus isoporae]